ncbi:MAG: 3-oxoacyl-[acyl-carrier-protein] reductase [Chitinivibrionales bacterium]|nr:3-oxoacyl-[acyl-carrier-protein] reductase [Chitinivibrionales bacterium]
MIDLTGKNALVTGAGRGIGKEIALSLARAGAHVALCDIDPDSAQTAAADVESVGSKALALSANVSDAGEVKEMFSSYFSGFETLDILVNNAGITRDSLIMRLKEEHWDAVLNVNLKSAYLCCKEAARPMMKARGGKIINIASVVGIMGNAGQVNYAASKAGLIGLTKTLAREFASRAINVNAVAPGFIQTAMTDKLSDSDKERLTNQIPMSLLGSPQDVANAVVFLGSSLSGYITGQVLTVDGGLVM